MIELHRAPYLLVVRTQGSLDSCDALCIGKGTAASISSEYKLQVIHLVLKEADLVKSGHKSTCCTLYASQYRKTCYTSIANPSPPSSMVTVLKLTKPVMNLKDHRDIMDNASIIVR